MTKKQTVMSSMEYWAQHFKDTRDDPIMYQEIMGWHNYIRDAVPENIKEAGNGS